MNTREVTHRVRLSQWAEVLREQKRSGLNIKRFCEAQGINRQQYYYWQRKLREAACEELAQREALQPAAPAGWSLCTAENPALDAAKEQATPGDDLIVEVGGVRLTVGKGYPVENLARLLRELV